jgi:hypothetical protein
MDSLVFGSSIAIHLFPNAYLHQDKQELNALPSEVPTERFLHPTNLIERLFRRTSNYLNKQVRVVEKEKSFCTDMPSRLFFLVVQSALLRLETFW